MKIGKIVNNCEFHRVSSAAQSDAQNVNVILTLPSTISSGPRKTVAPIFLAHEIAYFAFKTCSSACTPYNIQRENTREYVTARGSIAAIRSRKNKPLFNDGSLKFRMRVAFPDDATLALAHSTITSSDISLMPWRAANEVRRSKV